MDCKVLEQEKGEGKYKHVMGAVKVRQENGKTCNVGSGFSDEERSTFWKKSIKNKIIEVSYQSLTDDGLMRFPRFMRMRPDKTR